MGPLRSMWAAEKGATGAQLLLSVATPVLTLACAPTEEPDPGLRASGGAGATAPSESLAGGGGGGEDPLTRVCEEGASVSAPAWQRIEAGLEELAFRTGATDVPRA